MGVYPKMFFKKMDVSVENFLSFVKQKNAYYLAVDGSKPAVAVQKPVADGQQRSE
jgi:hypothetical protein